MGLKAAQTTGSIGAGSKALAVSDPALFAVGDQIIVAVGGESGQGMRGTVGVGGTWPALSYPDVPTMKLDVTGAPNTFAWARDSGAVYQFLNGAWAIPPNTTYYIALALPRALMATITAIAGAVLTLSAPAAAATTSAAVYYDNLPAFNAVMGPTLRVGAGPYALKLPPGAFAVSDAIEAHGCNGWSIRGAGSEATTIVMPPGVFPSIAPNPNSAIIRPYQCSDFWVSDLSLQGNGRLNGFGLCVSETNVPQGMAYPSGLLFGLCTGGGARNVVIRDVFQDAIGTSYCANVWAHNCSCVMRDPLMHYVQWMFQWADSVGGGCIDCSVDSPWLVEGFEAFRSKDVQFIRPRGRNASFSFNSAGSFLLHEPVLVFEPNSQHASGAFSASNPIINVNSNIGSDPYLVLGGTIVNPTMIQSGYINGGNDSLRGLVINADNPNVTVIDGSYSAPDYAAPSALYGAWGLDSTGLNTTVMGLKGFKVTGTSRPGYPNLSVRHGTSVNHDCQVATISK